MIFISLFRAPKLYAPDLIFLLLNVCGMHNDILQETKFDKTLAQVLLNVLQVAC